MILLGQRAATEGREAAPCGVSECHCQLESENLFLLQREALQVTAYRQRHEVIKADKYIITFHLRNLKDGAVLRGRVSQGDIRRLPEVSCAVGKTHPSKRKEINE